MIQNGTSSVVGFTNTLVRDVRVAASGTTTLATQGGWIGQSHFSRGVSSIIRRCSSTGAINNIKGGIVGFRAASFSGNLQIFESFSTGVMTGDSGGIVAQGAAHSSGTILVERCYSTGNIGGFAGGIFGSASSVYKDNTGTVVARFCYSTGTIGGQGGGIFGELPQTYTSATAESCFSLGPSNGGIYALGSDQTKNFAINCYVVRAAAVSAIFGGSSTIPATCAFASPWNSTTAAATLGATAPNFLQSPVGTQWVSPSINPSANLPFQLFDFQYSPYTTDPTDTFVQTVSPGGQTSAAVLAGNTFQLLAVNGSYPSGNFTINPTTGEVSVAASTSPGTYTLVINNVNAGNNLYDNSILLLTVPAPPAPSSNEIPLINLYLGLQKAKECACRNK